jgi:Arc/MetJ family transcription regulator
MVIVMRTNIVIDDALMNDVLKITGLKTKREAVELGLKKLLELKRQEQIKAFKGKLKWAGDLNVQRMDHADDKGEVE